MPDNKLPKPSDILGKSTLPSPSDILGPVVKKKAQSVASATGGFGSQLGSQTFQPTKAYVPTPLVGTGVQDFQKQEARRQVAAEKLSNKLKGQQAAYLAGQGEQGFVDVENAKLQSDYNQLQSVIQKDLGNKGNDFSITYNKLLQGTGAMISGGIDAGLNVLKYSNMTPFVNDATIIDYRANIAPDIKNFLKENIGADVDKGAERKYDEDFITGAIGGLAYSVPAMVTPFGIGLYSQAYDSGLDLINSTDAGKNLTEAEKTLFAGTLGAVMGRLEKVGLDKTLGRTLSSELANGLAFKAINELSKKGGAKITSKAIGDFAEASLRKTKNRLLNSADQGYRAFLDEFTTGGLQEVATIGAEQAVNKLKNKDIFDTQDMGEMFGRVLKSAAAEGVGGAILGTAKGGLLVNTKNHIVKKISDAKSFDDVRNLLLDVEKIGQENNYSPEEVQDVVDTVNDIVQKRQKLPQNLTPAQTTGIVSLIIDRDELTDNLKELELELNNTDDALKPVKAGELELVKKQIAAINTRIAEIAQNPEYAIQEPSTTSQVPSVIEGGQNIQEGSEGVGQGIEGTQAPQEAPIQEPTAEIIPEEKVAPLNVYFDKTLEGKNKWVIDIQDEDLRNQYEEDGEDVLWRTKGEAVQAFNDWLKSKQIAPKSISSEEEVARLRAEEQQELLEAIPNIEEYKVDGKIDKGLITNRKDLRKYNKIYAKYDKLITPLLAEAPAQATPAQDAGVSATNKSQLNNLKSRVTDSVKSAVIQTAERAINTLKSILPEFDIVIHENEDSYNNSVLGVGGQTNTRGNFSYSKNADGTYSGTIDINLNKANARTVAHEVAHAVLLKSFGENTKLFKTFRNKISKVLNSSRNAELIRFSNLYEGDVQAEEYLAELTAILEQQQDNLSPTVLQQIAAYINDIVSKLTNGAIKPFENVKDTKDIIDFFNAVSKSIREGAEISESDIKAIQEGASANIGSPTTINKSQKGEAIKFPDKPLPLSFVTSKDKVDIRALINEIVDKKQKVWFWMADQLGRGDYYDAVIDGNHYLDAGPSFALDPKNRKENILWASGVGRKALQDKINEADYIFFISGSPEKAKLFNRRVLDLVAERINVNSDFKSFKNAINSFGVETNDLKDIKSALDGINSFEELAKSSKRKPFLIAIDNIGKNKTMKPGSLKELLNGFNVFVDYNELRDGFYKENGFNQNDIMLVGKPTGLGGKAPHSTYENAIIGEVIGVPDVRMDSWNIMPQELRDKYKSVILGREEKTKPLQTKVIAAEIGQVRELEGQLPVSKSQQIDEELSKASGTTQIPKTTSSYVNAANEFNKLNVKGIVLDYGAGLGLGTDAMSKILGKPVESYEINPERWRGKKSVTYTKSEDIDGKFDGIVSLNVINVVPKNIRDFIIQDIYNHLKDGGKAIISSRKFEKDIANTKNFELGPEDKSYIVKRPKDGKLINVYQKGFDGNELIDYVKEVLGNKVDVRKANKGFGAIGVIIEKLPVSKSQKIQEEGNREALRVAGLPYLENTLDILSAKFGMPYKVIYNETLTSTGSIDYINYDEPTIIINTANATNDTPLIQYGNIFINQIKNTNKNLFSGLVKQVLNTKEGQAELEFAKERYSNDNYEDQVQQAIVSLLAKYAKNQFDPKTGIHKAIKKVWDTILDFLSKSFNVNINEIPASTTMEQLAKILSNPNISINKTTYSDTIKEEIVEDSKRALENRKKEYSEIEKIQSPSLIEIEDKRFIVNEVQFYEFYEEVEYILKTLKKYRDNQLLVDLTNIKSQISTYEGRANFNYDRYPLFTKLVKFVARTPVVALSIINNAIESGEDIIKYLDSESLYTTALDEDLNDLVSDIIDGYSIGEVIGLKPPPMYRVYSSTLDSVDEVKAKLENDIERLNKAIENPNLGEDYYYRNFRVPVGDDTYSITGNYRDGNISIEFSSEKYGMRDANEALFFKVLPKVIDAISYMYSDVDYNTISFTPITGESSKGRDLRLKGYNIFAKRLFGDFSLVAQNDNTTIIPIPEIFKNKLLKQERTVSRSQKVEGEGKAPQKGGPLARIKQAIEKSRAGKTSVGAPKKPLEFEEAEIIPSEKGKANLFKSLNAPARSLNKLKQASEGAGSFFNKVKRAAIDTKYDIAKALTKSKTPIGDIARAAMRNAKGYTGASSLVIKLVNSQIFDKLSFNPNVKMKLIDENGKLVDTVWSERQLFDAFLDANRIINIDARIRDKFSELVVLSRELKNGIKNESLTKEEQDELVNQISQLKDYLLRRKALNISGPEGQVQMIGYQDPDFVYTDKLINLLKEDYAPIQYTHTDGKTQADAEGILSEIKEQLPELYKTFDKMSSDYYDTFRYLLDESLKNGLITKEVYDELWSYNYIPTKFIQHFIEGELAIDNPSKAKKLSASLKNLTGGSEEDVITNYQYIMELYAHATYRRIFDNRAAVKLAQALGKIDPNKFGKDSKFFIQRPNGKDKKGNPTYSDPEKGYDYIKFMVDGVENRIIAPKQFVDIWYDSEFQPVPWIDSTASFVSKLTLVEFIKGVFTKYSPVFGITQFLLDAPQALISTKAYPDFFLGSVLLAKDYATVAKDVLSIVRDGKPTKFFVEAVQAGVFSDFLSTENDLIRGEKFTNYDGTDNIKNKVKYLIGRVDRGVDKTLQTIAKVNEAVEYSTRLAVYYRMKKNLTAKFKRNNNGAEPTGQDLENIQLLSAEQARIVVDFSVAGGVTKQLNRIFAYLNSTIQVFVSASRSLKNNPWKAGLMMLEIGAAGAAILAYSLGDLGGEDDEEKKKRYKEYKKLSTYEKESYFLMWTGNPDRPFLRIPKPPLFKGLINLFEQAYLHASRGEDFNQEKMWSAFQRDIPFGIPFAELIRNPAYNAYKKYAENYDAFRKQNIVKDEEKILDYAETKGATELYKKIGKASKDLGFKEGVSPKRLQEAVRSFTGDPTKNTWASLFDMGSKGSVALATGDTKELDEMFTGNPISDAFKNLGFEAKLFTKPIDYDASFAEELKEDEKEEYTKNYVIRGDVNEIRNNSNDLRSAVKSIYEYLKPKVESKEIDAEYANRVIKNQAKLFGLKDAPEFYDDVAYAKDNDIKAKMLNYYLSDMSNQEAGKVIRDMISRGLLSEEAFLKTINLRASKNK
jgi:ribosomal protein L29/predicted secreted Zn-dependent protease